MKTWSSVSAQIPCRTLLGGHPFFADERARLAATFLNAYRSDSDSGIHGAVEWTLRRWDHAEQIQGIDRVRQGQDRGDRRWEVNSQGQTLVLIEGPVEFLMGSPEGEQDRIAANETLHHRRIERRFVISSREVSVEQYQRFAQQESAHDTPYLKRYSPDLDGPRMLLSWYDAAAYCNWLSRREGLEPCYEPNADGQYAEGMSLVPDFLNRSGYRLPTEAEWEYACRAGTATSRSFGVPDGLLVHYAWFVENSTDRAWPCGSLKPNDLGMFDMHGNAWEWVLDTGNPYPVGREGESVLDVVASGRVEDKDVRILRGGGFGFWPANTRSADRFMYPPSVRDNDYGFRLARTYR